MNHLQTHFESRFFAPTRNTKSSSERNVANYSSTVFFIVCWAAHGGDARSRKLLSVQVKPCRVRISRRTRRTFGHTSWVFPSHRISYKRINLQCLIHTRFRLVMCLKMSANHQSERDSRTHYGPTFCSSVVISSTIYITANIANVFYNGFC